jgi:acetyltransferase
MMTCVVAELEPARATSERHPLDIFFAPETVAVFGATSAPGTVGLTVLGNLVRSPFGGTLYPISPGRVGVHGIRAYPSLAAVPRPVDLAIIATPGETVPDILGECDAAGVPGAVLLSAGSGDRGPSGVELERQVRQRLRTGSLRVLGPGSLGVAAPHSGLNATFAPALVPPGNVAFLSQSGALLTALLNQRGTERVGCSAFVSVGALLDIGWAEWIDYLGQDPRTECLGIYLETLDDAPTFFAAARRVARHKPIILVKGGDSIAAGSAGGARDQAFEEACRCNGVLRVHRLADLLRMAEILTRQPPPQGRRLTIVTNARGPGLLAADALHADGGRLAQNLVDVGDDADAERFARAAAVAEGDPDTDGLLVLLAPHATVNPVEVAEQLRPLARAGRKPILACWLWGALSPCSAAVLQEAGILSFHSPEAAIRIFGCLWRHGENQRRLHNPDVTEGQLP